MKKQFRISIYLDTRRKKEKGLYPVKLRVYNPVTRKQKLYPTTFEFTEKEFQSTWETKKPRSEHKENRLKIQALENRANDTASLINPFSFEKFEKKLYLKTGTGANVFYQYSLIIDKNRKFGRVGNANNYAQSLNSIKDYILNTTGKEPQHLHFAEVTPEFLNSYENYMLNVKGRSRTTVSMYLRALRAVFNASISDNEIAPELYPFGKKKYQVPSVKNVKKALTKDQLKQLFEAEPRTPEQERAKDFWFFSYACNGMNVKDIAGLRYENIQGNKIVYFRAKTINTAKADLKPVTVYLNDFTRSIIDRYGNPDKKAKSLVFPIITDNLNEAEKYSRIKNFTRFINQNLKKLAIAEGLPAEISTYWARHTFSTMAIRNGASMEFVSEALNHSDIKTTQNYMAGFTDEVKKEFSQNIMNF